MHINLDANRVGRIGQRDVFDEDVLDDVDVLRILAQRADTDTMAPDAVAEIQGRLELPQH